jgi:hypothetical protein
MRHRIDELKQHHQQRLEEAMAILEDSGKNAYRVASQMTWNLSYEAWEMIPVWQKFFATGEALAHLRHLEAQGKIGRQIMGDEILFFRQ